MNRKAIHFAGVLCLAVLASCNAPTASRHPDAAETVEEKFTAFNEHDAAAIESIYGADAVLHSPDYPNLSGNVPIAQTYRELFAAVPDAADEIRSFAVVGDTVYVEFILTGHWKGLPDRALHVSILSVYTVGNGHIVNDRTYYDRKAG